MPDRLALCSGGSKDGMLWRAEITARELVIQNISGSVGGAEVQETYTFQHLEFDDRKYHLWMLQDTDPVRTWGRTGPRRGVRTLVNATASERAAVECLPGSPCGLTSSMEAIE